MRAPHPFLWFLSLAALVSSLPGQGPEVITGRLLDGSGSPLLAAVATGVLPTDHVDLAELLARDDIRVDGTGRFRIRLGAGDRFDLVLAAPGRIAYRLPVEWEGGASLVSIDQPLGGWTDRMGLERAKDGAFDLGDLFLPRATTMFGRVRDEERTPLPGVRVTVVDLVGDHHVRGVPMLTLAAQARTDAHGIFRLLCVPAAALSLRFDRPGFSPLVLQPVSKETPLEVTMRAAAQCSGRLLDWNGDPAAGTVTLFLESGDRASVEVGEDGRFELWTDPELRYRLRVDRLGSVQGYSDLLVGPQVGMELRVPQGKPRTVEVHAIRQRDRAPIRSFQVKAYWSYSHRSDATSLVLGWSRDEGLGKVAGASGTLKLHPPEAWGSGLGVLYLRAEGYGEKRYLVHPPRGEETEVSVSVPMVPERSIAGRVLDPAGEPVPHARVWCLPRWGSGFTYTSVPPDVVPTDSEGRFRLKALGAYEYTLQVYAPGLPPPPGIPLDLVTESVVGLEISIPSRVGLHLRVQELGSGTGWGLQARSFYGRARAEGDAWVRFQPHSRSIVRRMESIAAFELWPGRLEFKVYKRSPGRVPNVLRWKVDGFPVRLEEETEKAVDGSSFRTGVLEGLARFGGGDRFRDRVVVIANSAEGSTRDSAVRALLRPDGTFRMELAAGDYVLTVADVQTGVELWLQPEKVTVLPDRTARVEIEPALGLLRVDVDPVKGHRASARDIVLSPLHQGRARSAIQVGGFRVSDIYMGAAVSLAHRSGPLWFLAPAGEVRVSLTRPVGGMGVGRDFDPPSVFSITVDVEVGQEHRVRMVEPVRPTDEELLGGR